MLVQLNRRDGCVLAGSSEMPEDAAQRLSHLESMLDDLTGLGELRGQIDEHSERLAEMFTRKASKVTIKHLFSTLAMPNHPFTSCGLLTASFEVDGLWLIFAVVDLIAQDDLDAMKSSMKGMGDSFNSQLQKQVSEIVTTLNETKEKTEGQLSGLSTQMGGKADSMFLDDLECARVSLCTRPSSNCLAKKTLS